MSSLDLSYFCGHYPVLRSVLADICRLHDPGAKLFAYLDDWYVWIKPQYLLQTFVLIAAATRSVNLELQPSKIQLWRASCQDPITAELQDKIKLSLSCLGGHLQIRGDIEPSPIVLGEQATMEKTTQRFQRIATTLADLNAEALHAQTVNDLLTVYVGPASQYVLRMSFVPEEEAPNLDTQVIVFWSHLIQRDVTSPLFFLPLKLGGLGVGSADTDTLFNVAPRVRAQLAQLQTTLSQQMNKPAFLLETSWRCPSPKSHTKRSMSPEFNDISTSNFLKASRTHPLTVLCFSYNPPHTPELTSCSPAAKRTRPRTAVFRVAVARRLMLPHPAAPNAADVVQSCSKKSAAGLICNKPVDLQQHHCYGCRYGAGVRCPADVIHSHSGTKVFIEQEVPALTRVVNGQREHARMDLVFNLNGSATYLDVSIVAPFSCNPSHVTAASTRPGHMAKRAEKSKFDRYPHINFVPFILETTGRPGPHARKFISNLMRDADNPPLAIRDTWSAIESVLHSAISKQQLTAAVT